VTTPTQRPVPLTPAAAQPTDTGGATGSTTVEGSITVTILNQKYTLTGTLGAHLIVEYHASFEDAITVGSIDDIVGNIGNAVGYPNLGAEIKTFTSSQGDLANVPVLKNIFSMLTEVKIKITDLEINTQTNTYGVGLALDFTSLPPDTTTTPPTPTPPPKLLGIELLSVGFKVTRVNPTPAQ
jgi:hypothetical protein